MKSAFLCFAFMVVCLSCSDKRKALEKKIQQIPVAFKVNRFDLDFTDSINLAEVKAKYPYMFPERFADSVWVNILKDPIQQELRTEVKKAFPNFDKERADLELLFKHVKYYFPNRKIPNVVTLISEVNYEQKVIYADSLLLVCLDTYLGPKHKFYVDIYDYIKQNMDKPQMIADVAEAFAAREVPFPKTNTFLSVMLYEGKKLYIKDLLTPEISDNVKIGYVPQQLQWAIENEGFIWSYFIENELLFSTDKKLLERFVNLAPFSKFYMEVDNSSSPRIGRYIGWQIIRAFMDNNPKVSWKTMLNMPDEELFNKSQYKPRK